MSEGLGRSDLYERLFSLTSDLGWTDEGKAKPLPGSELPWREWVAKYYTSATSAPFARRHEDLWEWMDSLSPSVVARPYVAVWGRGGGKSSTVEMGVARVCAKLTRRFALYVCGTQDSADTHVQTIAERLEGLGVERAVNKFGQVQGWRREQLRTANGFNVAGIGLDKAIRGVKLGDYRPDLIIFDDIDSLDDSIDATEKKIRAITESILPTGSPDCAVLFVQNRVHANSVASQLADNRADFLHNRLPVAVSPAVEGLKYETLPAEPGSLPQIKITGGEPTWQGQNLDVCERQINTWGLTSFLRESQHEVSVSGSLFFPEFEGINRFGPGMDGRHVCLPRDIPAYWHPIEGLDWGYAAPFCYLLGYVDDIGGIWIVDEIYAPGLTNKEQAEAVAKKKMEHGVRRDTLIACDPSMWAKKHHGDNIGRADIEDFWAAGLGCVEANNNRQHGFTNMREYLAVPGMFHIFKGRCPNLIRSLTTAVFSRKKSEDLDDDADLPPGHMDAVAALRYLMMTRPYASVAPKTPEQVEQEWAVQTARARQSQLIGHKQENSSSWRV